MLARLVQGSPGRQHMDVLLRHVFSFSTQRCAILCALIAALLAPAQLVAQTEAPTEMIRSKLRIAWGGSTEHRWQGSISLTSGKIRLINLLGMEADEARAVQPAQGRIEINHLSPRIYDGFDIQIEAPPTAQLTIQLSANQNEQIAPISIPVNSLMQQPYQAALDDVGSRILVQRNPGDVIRTSLNRDHLVFSPSESLRVGLSAYRTNFPPGTSVQTAIKLKRTRTTYATFEKTIDATVDAQGNINLGDALDIPMPEEEGVYDLTINLTEQRLTSLVFASKPAYQRTLQLVVIDPELRYAPPQTEPRPIASFDPSMVDWWPRLSKLAYYNPWQKSKTSELHNNSTKTIEHLGRKWQQLGVNGWHAYPLPIEAIGSPMVVEVEYPSDLEQSLGISIIEPDAAGMITPIGLDSGVDVTLPQPGEKPGERKHRLVFWPRTSTPMLLLTSRDKNNPATYGRISVLAGLPQMPDLTNAPEDFGPQKAEDRLAIAFWDKPLFAKGFGAPEDLNYASNRSLEDWLTFLEGSNRVIEHLKRVGFNAACISVMSEGGALYPSPHFRSTPKFDKGLFFDDGRDPFKKDVAELLFRQFDRAELRLIPAMELNAPLAKLEDARINSADPNFAALFDHVGRPAIDGQGASSGKGNYYNPLDEEVQQAISDLVLDFVSRYGHHPSFAGLSINLDSDGYALLPGPQWGMDNETLARFAQSLPPDQQQVFANLPNDLNTRRDWVLQKPQWEYWLKWRGERMFQLHARMATILRSANPNAVLYLNTAGCFHGSHAKKRLMPELPRNVSATDVLLEQGIDARRYKAHPNIALLESNFVRPRGNEKRAAWYKNYQAAIEDETSYADEDNRGVLHFHVPDTLHVAGFDQAKPFGREGNFTWLASEFVGSGAAVRKPLVEHLAKEDDLSVFYGGWMLPMGQDEALHEFLTIYKMLPAGNYHRLNVPQSQPLVIRKMTTGTETTLYFVNPTPWDLNATLTVQLPSNGTITPFATSQISRGQQSKGEGQWSLSVPAYGLIACKVDVYDVAISGAKVYLPTGVMRSMKERLDELAFRVQSIRSIAPIAILENSDFELPLTEGEIPGWQTSSQPGTSVSLDKQKIYEGQQSLRLKSSGPVVWARSEEFTVPDSRRLMVKMHLLSEGPPEQPSLRIVYDGYVGNQNVYLHVSVGADTDYPLQPSWSEFAYPMVNLPPDLENVKVGFDMMGAGNVLVDRIEIYDLAFREEEIKELNKLVTLTYSKYQRAEVGDCYRLLNSHWVKFLEGHVPIAPALAQQLQENRAAGLAKRNVPKEEPEKSKTWLETFRSYTPRFPRFQ